MHIDGYLSVYRVPEGIMPGKNGYRIKDLKEIVGGDMWVGFHTPADFYEPLKARIDEKAEELANTPLLIQTICIDGQRRLSRTPIVIVSKEEVAKTLRKEAAQLIYSPILSW